MSTDLQSVRLDSGYRSFKQSSSSRVLLTRPLASSN